MKRGILISVLVTIGFLVILVFLLRVPFVSSKGISVAKVSFFLGSLEVQPKAGRNWEKAILNQAIHEGEKLKTSSDSRAEITLASGSIIRMDENSTLDMVKLSGSGSSQQSKAKVWSGKVWASVSKLGKQSSFGLESPTAVAAARGTVYRMTVTKDTTTIVRVYDGKIEVSNPEMKKTERKERGEIGGPTEIEGPKEVPGPREVSIQEWHEIVTALMEIVITPDGKHLPPTKFDFVADSQEEWVQWNKERDKALKR